MANDEQPVSEEQVDRTDSVRHGSEEARDAARAKLQAALKASQSGEAESESAEGEDDHHFSLFHHKHETSDTQSAVSNTALLNDLQKQEEQKLTEVKVYSPFRVYFDGEAMSLSAANETGPFDILPGHKNFMTLLSPCEIIIRTRRGEDRIKIERGVLHVRNNQLVVFLDV